MKKSNIRGIFSTAICCLPLLKRYLHGFYDGNSKNKVYEVDIKIERKKYSD